MASKFLRRVWFRYSKLGKGRKKLQKWRRPTGRDNKMREKRKGYSSIVSIGYRKSNVLKNENKIIVVSKISELDNLKKGESVVLGHMGTKKKIQAAKIAKERGIKIQNLNIKKTMKKEKKNEPKK